MSAGAPLLTFNPSEKISMDLSSNELARATIKCTNTGKTPIAFKVKTTAPKRYLVKPNQGVVAPGQTDRIQIQIVPKERTGLIGKSSSEDRFMVLSVACGEGLLKLEKDSEAYTAELASLWSGAASGAQHHAKFSVSFTSPLTSGDGPTVPGSNNASGAQGERLREMLSRTGGGGAQGASPNKATGPGGVVPSSDVLGMRKKYDELVSYTVNLTAERDRLKTEVEKARKEQNKATVARLAAEKDDAGGRDGSKVASVTKSDGDGFSFLQLLLVALVCFLLGRYLNTIDGQSFNLW